MHKQAVVNGQVNNLYDRKYAFIKNGQPKCQFVLDEAHWVKIIWNSILCILVLYTATYMPYKLSFVQTDSEA